MMTVVVSQETSLDDVPAALPLKPVQQQDHPLLAEVAPQVAKIQVSFGFRASPPASSVTVEDAALGVAEGDDTDATRDTPSTPNPDGDAEKTPSDPGVLQQDSAPPSAAKNRKNHAKRASQHTAKQAKEDGYDGEEGEHSSSEHSDDCPSNPGLKLDESYASPFSGRTSDAGGGGASGGGGSARKQGRGLSFADLELMEQNGQEEEEEEEEGKSRRSKRRKKEINYRDIEEKHDRAVAKAIRKDKTDGADSELDEVFPSHRVRVSLLSAWEERGEGGAPPGRGSRRWRRGWGRGTGSGGGWGGRSSTRTCCRTPRAKTAGTARRGPRTARGTVG